jgi:putative addiction module component (TIGR02574 family)
MTSTAHRLLHEVLALPEDERLELASQILASVEGPRDAGWEAAWLAELDRRTQGPAATGPASSDWGDESV